MPGAPQAYIRPLQNGFANATRTPYEGTYLYVTAQYDNKGNILSVTDVGRSVNGGKNITKYAYSPDDTVLTTTVKDASGTATVVDSSYDPLGRMTSRSVHNDGAGKPAGWWRLNETDHQSGSSRNSGDQKIAAGGRAR